MKVLNGGGTLWAGTSGLVLPVPNMAAAPPLFRDKPRLVYYSSIFNSLEINSSFYKLPMPATFGKWGGLVADDFRFTVKLGRHVTHEKGLAFNPGDVVDFLKAANRLGSKKGALLLQFPPGLRYTAGHADRLRSLMELIVADQGADWPLAVEFRHPSWYIPSVNRLLDSVNASLVLHDIPASAVGRPNEGAPFLYLRFHGPAGDYRGGYTPETLGVYARQVADWLAKGKDAYVYFNNTIGDAVKDCLAFVAARIPEGAPFGYA
ncbi:MAG TPA: DUF72 domain-containing protein [Puia sp.]|nr:DUF72 domain-containing protein [Puia sp.]